MLTLTVTGQPTSRYDTTWTFTLTNTGDQTVTTQPLDSQLCGLVPLSASTLAPGQSVTAECSSTVTESTIGTGMGMILQNVSETAYDSLGQPYSATASVRVVAPQ